MDRAEPDGPPEPPRWVIEATLVLALVAHAACLLGLTLSARLVPLLAAQACLFSPLSLGLALYAARSVVRRREGRARLAALTLLVGASTITPRLGMSSLEQGASRDLARVGGAAPVVSEGRALLTRWAEEGRPGGAVPPADLGPALRGLGVDVRVVPGRRVLVKSYGFGDFHGFVILPEGAAPEGRAVADGLCWWSDADVASR